MQINPENLQKKIDLVKADMFSRFPDCRHTIQILLWDDGTDSVECRYGDDEHVIHTSTFYNGELKYEVMSGPEGMMVQWPDEAGQEKWYYLTETEPKLEQDESKKIME